MEKDERLLPILETNDLQTVSPPEPTQYAPIYDDEFSEGRSIREYWNVVYKRLPLILALSLLTTTAVAFYMYRQPSIYEANAEMIVEPRKPKLQSKDAININFGGDANYYNTQLRLLQNPDLMRNVVLTLNLQRDPNLFNNQNRGFLGTIRSIFSSDKSNENKETSLPTLTENSGNAENREASLTPEEKERVERYTAILLGGLRVGQVEGTNIVNITLQSTNPTLAAKAANTVGEVFIKDDIRRETEGGKRTLEDLGKSIEDLKANINLQEQERLSFMSKAGLPLQPEKGGDLSSARLQDLSTRWLSAEDDRRKLQGRYEATQRAIAKGEILSVVGDNPAIQEARKKVLERKADLEKRLEDIENQIRAAETEKAALLVKYNEEFPAVKVIISKIESLNGNREKIQKEVSQKLEIEGKTLSKNAEAEVLAGQRADLEAAHKRANELQAAYATEVASANGQGIAATRLTTLTREIETNRTLLDTYIQQQKQMELSFASSQPDNIKLSTPAMTPGAPIGPNRSRNIMVALLLSLAAGVGFAFLMDYLDDSIKSSDDIGRYLGLPTLALIPFTTGAEKRKLNNLNGNQTAESSSLALIASGDKRSAMVEAYRHLRTSLLFSSAGKPPQTILVTSAQPSEGKTTTAINTAITLAQSGGEVLIIDCDLRRPRLHKHFSLSNVHGLTSYLSNDKNPESLIQQSHDLPNLKVITSGPIPPNPAELISSNEMKNLLQYLKGNYKHIVIDSPPAIFFTDAAILSMIVDGVVLVTLAGKSSIHLTRRFKQRLSSIGAKIYGVVLNGIRSTSLEYDYYGYGYSSYYTANKEDDSTPHLGDEDDSELFSSISGKR